MTDILDRKRSVTRADFLETAEPSLVWNWTVMDPGALTSPIPHLPPIGSRLRDRMLASTPELEDMWGIALNKAITKIASRGYEVSDQNNSDRRVGFGRDLVLNLDGEASYRTGIAKVLLDFLTTDNGYFCEIERVAASPTSKIRALWHLDSHHCYRTGNLDYPVIYQDVEGVFHKLRRDQVLFGAEMPSARREQRNRGRCAAARAFGTIIKLSAVETYFREKITGARGLALHFLSGLGARQLEQAVDTSKAEQVRKGHVVYRGAVLVPIEGDQPIQVATVDLAGVPDGFDVDQERRDAYLRYANAIGVPVQDIQPLSGQGLGTGAQTVILDEAAEGQGLAYFQKLFEDQVNYLVMPKSTTFVFKTNDLRDQEQRAKVDAAKVAVLSALMGTGQQPGIITQPMALQMAVDAGLVPREFIPEDVTPGSTLTDSGEQSKPAGEVMPGVWQAAQIQQAAQQLQAPAALPVTKAFALTDDAIDAAIAWAQQEYGSDDNV